MFFQSASPGINLKDIVIDYWQAAYPESPGKIIAPPKIPAAISLHMIFNLKKVFRVRKSSGEGYTVPTCFIRGHLTEPLFMEDMMGSEAFCINLKPTAAFRMWGLPVAEFANTPISLEDVFGSRSNLWIDAVLEAKSFRERVLVCEKFLFEALLQSRHNCNRIHHSLELIKKSAGICTVYSLADNISLSHRQFDRLFLQQVGLSPKLYSSIIRINYIISEVNKNKSIDWQEVIYKYGYFDQSHLIKDFSKQTGELPTKYFKDLLYNHAQHFIVKP